MSRTAKKTIRMIAGALMLFALGAVTVDRRCQVMRKAYLVRQHLDRQAVLENEIRYLQGQVIALEKPRALLQRAERMGVVVGTRPGQGVAAPPALTASSEE